MSVIRGKVGSFGHCLSLCNLDNRLYQLTKGQKKMKFRIHGTYQDGTKDTWLLEGSLEEIREMAQRIVKERNLKDYWSEEL